MGDGWSSAVAWARRLGEPFGKPVPSILGWVVTFFGLPAVGIWLGFSQWQKIALVLLGILLLALVAGYRAQRDLNRLSDRRGIRTGLALLIRSADLTAKMLKAQIESQQPTPPGIPPRKVLDGGLESYKDWNTTTSKYLRERLDQSYWHLFELQVPEEIDPQDSGWSYLSELEKSQRILRVRQNRLKGFMDDFK